MLHYHFIRLILIRVELLVAAAGRQRPSSNCDFVVVANSSMPTHKGTVDCVNVEFRGEWKVSRNYHFAAAANSRLSFGASRRINFVLWVNYGTLLPRIVTV